MLRILNLIRRTELGKKLQPVLFIAGNIFRHIVRHYFPKLTVNKRLSIWGLYRFSAKFLFSDFSYWSTKHNSGFNALIEESKSKLCVFDIGAHIGLTTLPLAKNIKPRGAVYAFEPAKTNLVYLKMHLTANDVENVIVVESLVGDVVKSNMCFYVDSDASGVNSIANIRNHLSEGAVDMVSIDSYCDQIGAVPDLIKIDVEGAEFMVLQGGKKVLTSFAPVIFLSVHPRQLNSLGVNGNDLIELIELLGYEVWDVRRQTRDTGQLTFGEYRLEKNSTVPN